MFQLVRPKQRSIDLAPASSRAPQPARVVPPGKRTLAEHGRAPSLGEPDFYSQAVDSALRGLDAIRRTALPAYAAVRKKPGMSPLAKQIELVRAALVVQQMVIGANAHVAALENAETYVDPMVRYLRARLDRIVALASRLGIYDNAEHLKPVRDVEPVKRTYDAVLRSTMKPGAAPPVDPSAALVSSLPARVRIARGTGAPPPPTVRPVASRPAASPLVAARIRPGFGPAAGR